MDSLASALAIRIWHYARRNAVTNNVAIFDPGSSAERAPASRIGEKLRAGQTRIGEVVQRSGESEIAESAHDDRFL
jgi:hypothetical protein